MRGHDASAGALADEPKHTSLNRVERRILGLVNARGIGERDVESQDVEMDVMA